MDNSQRQMFRHQVELLETQIQEQRKREQVLRALNEALEEQCRAAITDRDLEEDRSAQLANRLEALQRTHSQELQYYQAENASLRAELADRCNEAARRQVDWSRRELVLAEKVALLEGIVEKKCDRVGNLQKKLHDQSICGLRQGSTDLPFSRGSADLSCSRGPTNMPHSRRTDLAMSAISQWQGEPENNMRLSNLSSSRQSRVSELMRLDKSQLKVMMGAVQKSKQQLQQGNFDVYMCATKRNQTFCK